MSRCPAGRCPRMSKAAAVLFLALLGTTPVLAAPTCLNRAGDTVRCDRAGAMPIGWTLPADEARARALAPDRGLRRSGRPPALCCCSLPLSR